MITAAEIEARLRARWPAVFPTMGLVTVDGIELGPGTSPGACWAVVRVRVVSRADRHIYHACVHVVYGAEWEGGIRITRMWSHADELAALERACRATIDAATRAREERRERRRVARIAARAAARAAYSSAEAEPTPETTH